MKGSEETVNLSVTLNFEKSNSTTYDRYKDRRLLCPHRMFMLGGVQKASDKAQMYRKKIIK